MTKEERVLKLHEKMAVRKQKKENARTWAAGAGSLALFACLIALIGSSGPAHLGATAGLYSGATLLFEGTGGYVLAALIAFMAGVVITIVLKMRHGNRTGDVSENDMEVNKRC